MIAVIDYKAKFTSNKIKNSYHFLFFYFNDIMHIKFDEIEWNYKTRSHEMLKIINHYRKLFLNDNYSNIQIWKIITRKYNKHFDFLLYDSLEYTKTQFKCLNNHP